jgi:hypothetical protein
MKKSFGLKNNFTWEEVRSDATMNDYILVFDFDNFSIFCENTNKKYIEIKNHLDNKDQ